MAIDAITNAGQVAVLNTEEYFDETYSEGQQSPIDNFIKNTNQLNKIISTSSFDPVTANLLLLGYMSAVESYVRAVVRRVINIDEVAQKKVESKEVIYGAAIHHDDLLMPEALMRGISFAGVQGIKSAIKDLLSIKGNFPEDLKLPLTEFIKICQLRHCVVHRFGKLGINNAIDLGLEEHKEILEKPLNLDEKNLQDIAETLRCFVKSLNNYLFFSLIERTCKNRDDSGEKQYKVDWHWNYNRDKKRFTQYYDIFASTLDATPSDDIQTLYNEVRNNYRP